MDVGVDPFLRNTENDTSREMRSPKDDTIDSVTIPDSLPKLSTKHHKGMKRIFSHDNFSASSTPLPKDAEMPFGITEGDYNVKGEFAEMANKEIENQIIAEYGKKQEIIVSPFIDLLPVMREGVEAIVKDSFTECFTSYNAPAWNFNIPLFIGWCIGIFVRYCILLPLRVLCLLLGTLSFTIACFFIYFTPQTNLRIFLYRKAIQYFGAIWLTSMSAVVKFHGIPPVRRPNQIYVANHTSLIDFIILGQHSGFASVGQKHGGFVGFMQTTVVGPLRNIWFERFESRDRRLVAERIKKHISDISNPPLLIFPEGVCVNNDYCVMFKKGVFEIEDVEICPIAIKYNKLFSDPYWSSKDESFIFHILRIMRSWCLVCDVYFLEPQTKMPSESAVAFTSRIKTMICKRSGLKDIPWDGYLKYYTPSQSLLAAQQKIWANRFKERWLSSIAQDEQETNRTNRVVDTKEETQESKKDR